MVILKSKSCRCFFLTYDGCKRRSLWERWILCQYFPGECACLATHHTELQTVSCQYLLGVAFIAFSTYPLLGSCLLTNYAHKHMRLLTRVYGSCTQVSRSLNKCDIWNTCLKCYAAMYLWHNQLKFNNCHIQHSEIWLVLPPLWQQKSTVGTWVSYQVIFFLMNGLNASLGTLCIWLIGLKSSKFN